MDKIKELFTKVPGAYYLKIHTASNLTVPPSWNIEKRYINDFHILFVRGGHGYYILNGHKIELNRGQVVFVGGGAYYESEQDFSNPLQIIPIRFGFYNNKNGKQMKPLSDKLYYNCNSINAEELEFLFLEIIRLNNPSKNAFADSNTSSLLHTILCRSLYEAERNTDSKQENRLEKIHKWIRMHPVNRSNIGELAKRTGISRKYFTTLFKRQYGLSPKTYQVSQRMNYAKYLLHESNCSIKEIASQLGYTDQYIFSKQFKSIIGCAPSKIRNTPHSS